MVRPMIIGCSVAMLLGLASVATALMPPHLTGVTPAVGASLPQRTLTLHGYSLRHASSAPKITNAKGVAIAAKQKLACKWVGKDNGCSSSSAPGAQQQKCTLTITLPAGKLFSVNYLEWMVVVEERSGRLFRIPKESPKEKLRREVASTTSELRKSNRAISQAFKELIPALPPLWVSATASRPIEQVKASKPWKDHVARLNRLSRLCQARAYHLGAAQRTILDIAPKLEAMPSQKLINIVNKLAVRKAHCGQDRPVDIEIQSCLDSNSPCTALQSKVEEWLREQSQLVSELQVAVKAVSK